MHGLFTLSQVTVHHGNLVLVCSSRLGLVLVGLLSAGLTGQWLLTATTLLVCGVLSLSVDVISNIDQSVSWGSWLPPHLLAVDDEKDDKGGEEDAGCYSDSEH